MGETHPTAPVFIVGPGRSGTTLVRSLLSAHSRLCVTPETHFLKTAEAHGGLATGAPADFDAFWARYSASPRFKDLGVDPERCRQLVAQRGEPTMRSIFAALLDAYGERCGKPRVGEKTPGHWRWLDEIEACFPGARTILLRRDPRAVVASQLKTPWGKPNGGGSVLESRAARIALYAREWRELFTSGLAERPSVLVVDYEALVSDAEREARRMCAFLGESYEPAMLTDRSDRNAPPPAAMQDRRGAWSEWAVDHNRKTLSAISTASVEAWRSELGRGEVAMIEGWCATPMRAAGHLPVSSRRDRALGTLGLHAVRALESAEGRARRAVRGLRRAPQG